ncbi:hypothetical protein ACKWTF_004517 [Chironomus riparius]
MKSCIIILLIISVVNTQINYQSGSSLGNFEISQVSNGANVRVIGPGSSSINGINISGNRGNQRKSSSEINTVHIDGQNGGTFGGPLRINQRSENDFVRIGPNRATIPNFNPYPQNNAYANNKRPDYFQANPQFAAPASLRPSFQYPSIRNSLNNGNDYLKNIVPGGGGLSLPFPYFWG